MEAKPGGAYRFWGKHTYGSPAKSDATQKILRLTAPSQIAYSWAINGRPSEVSIAIEASPDDPNTTVLKGKHAFVELPNIDRAKELVDDLWRLQCGNLTAYLASGSGMLLPDYADPSPSIKLSIMIDAPREKVFQALMDPAILNKWVASACAGRAAGGRPILLRLVIRPGR